MPQTILREAFGLRGGQEWYSDPIRLAPGQRVRVACQGTVRFYAGVFGETYFETILLQRTQRRQQFPFPFVFGSDRSSYYHDFQVRDGGEYRLVVRVGVFTVPGQVTVSVDVFQPWERF